MKSKKALYYFIAFVISVLAIQACGGYYFRSNYKTANALMHDSDSLKTKLFLKAHPYLFHYEILN